MNIIKIFNNYIMNKKNIECKKYLNSYILFRQTLFAVAFQVLAVYVAYKCNKRTETNNKYLSALLAFLFPDIYLMQAGIRKFFLDDYKC